MMEAATPVDPAWLDTAIERYLCDGPGASRSKISFSSLLLALGVPKPPGGGPPVCTWRLTTQRLANRSLWRLGWRREAFIQGDPIWHRPDRDALVPTPRSTFEAEVFRQVHQHLSNRSNLAGLVNLKRLAVELHLKGTKEEWLLTLLHEAVAQSLTTMLGAAIEPSTTSALPPPCGSQTLHSNTRGKPRGRSSDVAVDRRRARGADENTTEAAPM